MTIHVTRIFTATLLSLLIAGHALGEEVTGATASADDPARPPIITLHAQSNARLPVTPNDRRYHLLPAATAEGGKAALSAPQPRIDAASADSTTGSARSGGGAGASATKFFPATLSYLGGSVVEHAAHDLVYLDRPNGATWGDPATFLDDLGASKFMHIVDQYVSPKHQPKQRYVVGNELHADAAFCTYDDFCTAEDILDLVRAAAAALGGHTGYHHIIHVFLPPGVDTCIDEDGTACYSPDYPQAFAFCAYHSSVVFADVGKVLFTVQPYQLVSGCAAPDFSLGDSTNSALSHEVFETITDPDLDAWIAVSSAPTLGNEIADLCASPVFHNTAKVAVNGRAYHLQLEYSNKAHACVGKP